MATKAAQATVTACPPSAVVDMIVPWSQVHEGDLALYLGRLDEVTGILPYPVRIEGAAPRVQVHHGGSWHCLKADDLTAVRRYTEG